MMIQEKKIKEEEISSFEEMTEFTKGGIFFVGSQDVELLSQFEDEPEMKETYKKKNFQKYKFTSTIYS